MTKEFKSFFKNVGGGEGARCNYPVRLDTYGCGCAHDCKYCYAKSLLDFRKMWNPLAPAAADPNKVRSVLDRIASGKLKVSNAIRLGGMTDCFQPCEQTHKVTYQVIKEMNKRRIPYLIVTKSDLVASDEYVEILDKELAHVQVTVTTTDDDLSLKYEKAVVPSRRIAGIEKLQSLGFDVAIRVSPFIPEFIDYDKLNAVKCDKAIIEFLRVNGWIRKWFGDMVDFSNYIVKSGGYRHLPLEIKKELIKNIHFKEVSVCEDEDNAYEYWKNHFNHNPEDCCNLRR